MIKNLFVKIKNFNFKKHKALLIVSFFILLFSITGIYHTKKTMPLGTDFTSKTFINKSEDIKFLYDLSYEKDAKPVREQIIFDTIIKSINEAKYYILIDMFLFNGLLGNTDSAYRALSEELTRALIDKKKSHPEIKIDLVTDPINTVYGGASSKELTTLRENGINVIVSNLEPLRDSNPIYSSIWHNFFKIFGNSDKNGWLKNPFAKDAQKVTLRSYLSLLNFKANHRKIFIADNGDSMQSLVASANPHDGSSAHSNVAIQIKGDFWQSIWLSESAVAQMSGATLQSPPVLASEPKKIDGDYNISLELISEGQIKKSLLEAFDVAQADDEINLAIFYLSDRDIIKSLLAASDRNVNIKIIMDPNKDAFGYKKNGIPNRQVAHELSKKSNNKIEIRWYDTHGEQFHTKLAYIAHKNGPTRVILGSANFTRRNIGNFNLETDVQVIARSSTVFIQDVKKYFNRIWNNVDANYSLDYSAYQDDSLLKYLVYLIQEEWGLSSF